MKYIIFISTLFLSITAFGQGPKDDTLFNELSHIKTDILKLNQRLDFINKEPDYNNLNITLHDLDKIMTMFSSQKKENMLEKTLPYLIPIIVLILGAIITLSQLKIQGKLTLVHSRSNNIAEARIKWNNDLRLVLSKLIRTSTELHYHLRTALDKIAERDKYELNSEKWKMHHNEADQYYQSHLNLMVDFIALTGETQLYLDIKGDEKDNKTHVEFEKILSEYGDSIMEYPNIKDVEKFDTAANELIRKSRNVLNDSWDKARNEGKIDLDNAFEEASLTNRLKKIFTKNNNKV